MNCVSRKAQTTNKLEWRKELCHIDLMQFLIQVWHHRYRCEKNRTSQYGSTMQIPIRMDTSMHIWSKRAPAAAQSICTRRFTPPWTAPAPAPASNKDRSHWTDLYQSKNKNRDGHRFRPTRCVALLTALLYSKGSILRVSSIWPDRWSSRCLIQDQNHDH